MAKDIYEENKELKRALFNIEKAVLEFRLTQLDLPLEKVNVPSVLAETKAVPYTLTTCSCNDGEGCNCDLDKETLKEQIEDFKARLNGTRAELEYWKNKANEVNAETIIEEEVEPELEESSPKVEAEPYEVEETKKKRTRKERGGTVFTDFKSLSLENNDFEGNSIVYSKKDV